MSIKTSKHSIQYSNQGKRDDLSLFLDEYRRVAGLVVDYIWDHGIETEHGAFKVCENAYDLPKYLPTSVINQAGIETFLSGRTLKCLITQVRGILSASVEKQRKRLYVLNKKKEEGATRRERRLLARKIKTNIPQKPNVSAIRPELNSICVDFVEVEGEFDLFIRLKSITKTKIEIRIPIKYTRHSNKLKDKSKKMLPSILVGSSDVDLRWELKKTGKRTEGAVVGADQGYKDVLTLSNASKTPNECPHGHSLQSIIGKLSKKKKGSKAFKRAQDHRKNFINWSINQLNLDQVKQVNLEQIWNIGYKSSTSRALSHWTNTLIRDKLVDRCDEHGVHVKYQSSTYRSQRCSSCGLVRKANRKGKTYSCKGCGIEIDSDLNAALNHEIDLPEIPYTLRGKGHNRGHGFYWQSSGITDLSGRSLESLPPAEPK